MNIAEYKPLHGGREYDVQQAPRTWWASGWRAALSGINRGRKLRHGISLLVLGLALSVCGCSQPDLTDATPVRAITAVELTNSWRMKPEFFRDECRGKVLDITGTVSEVSGEGRQVSLDGVVCRMSRKGKEQAAGLSKGMRVVIRGECADGQYIGRSSSVMVDVKYCVLVGPAKKSPTWKLEKMPASAYDVYHFGTSETSHPGIDTSRAVRILFDNGSSETLTVHLPEDNAITVAGGRFLVLYAQVKDFQFGVSSPTQPRRDFEHPLEPKPAWHTTYVFNFRALHNYRIELRTYQFAPLREPPPDQAYEVASQEWFEVKTFPGTKVYHNVDYFFEPFPASIARDESTPLGATLTEASKVRIVRQ